MNLDSWSIAAIGLRSKLSVRCVCPCSIESGVSAPSVSLPTVSSARVAGAEVGVVAGSGVGSSSPHAGAAINNSDSIRQTKVPDGVHRGGSPPVTVNCLIPVQTGPLDRLSTEIWGAVTGGVEPGRSILTSIYSVQIKVLGARGHNA